MKSEQDEIRGSMVVASVAIILTAALFLVGMAWLLWMVIECC
jgi:hypothetical protein